MGNLWMRNVAMRSSGTFHLANVRAGVKIVNLARLESVLSVGGEHIPVLDLNTRTTYAKRPQASILRKLAGRVANLSPDACCEWVVLAHRCVMFRESDYDASLYGLIRQDRTEVAGAVRYRRDAA